MKHIKTFESVQNSSELKKYIIWKSDSSKVYSIMEINRSSFGTFDFHRLFCVTDKILKDDRKFTQIFLDSVLKNTFYTSDELSDCVNHMKLIIAAKKYNL